MIAIQIRRKLFPETRFDIAVTYKPDSLYLIQRSGKLEDVFDKTYLIDEKSINSWFKKTEVLIGIKNAVRTLYHPVLDTDYTDIFFWNPSECLYCAYVYLMKFQSVKLHVYADAFGGGYTCDSPDDGWPKDYAIFKNGIWDYLFKKKYGVKSIREYSFDYYMFRDEISLVDRKREVRTVPLLDFCKNGELDFFNMFYGYKRLDGLSEKYCFIANCLGEKADPQYEKQIVKTILDIVGNENFMIKYHPRDTGDTYTDYNVNVLSIDYPLELFILNNNCNEYVFIADESSTVFYVSLLMKKKIRVLFLRSLYSGIKIFKDYEWDWYVEKMKEEGSVCYEPRDVNELRMILLKLEAE